MLQIAIITLFPEMFRALESFGITSRALQERLISLRYLNPRDFTNDKYHTVDDKPYGGGAGMLLKPEPLVNAIRAAKKLLGENTRVYYLSPQAYPLTQKKVQTLTHEKHMILLCGRYEGIDQRVIDHFIDEEISVGDYVLSGGELPAMLLLDAITRVLPNALGNPASAMKDSYAEPTQQHLDFPQYTRPESFEGYSIPAVLKTGDHQAIQAWREKESLKATQLKRPDLLK